MSAPAQPPKMGGFTMIVLLLLFIGCATGGMKTGALGFMTTIATLPRPMREAARHAKKGADGAGIGCVVAVIFFPLAIVLATTPTFWPNVIVIALAIAM